MGRPRPLSASRLLRLLRGVSGLLAGGLVALAVVLVVVGVVAVQRDVPGPGMLTILEHVAAAVVAVLVQVRADRTRGAAAVGAALVVVALSAVVLGVRLLA